MESRDVEPEGFLEYRLIRVAEQLRRRFQEALRPHGLTVHQFSVLAVLQARPGVTIAELARLVLVTPQSMRALVEQLERAGWVQLPVRRGRGRPAPITIAPAGSQVLQAAAASVRDLDTATREALGESEPALMQGLAKLERLLL